MSFSSLSIFTVRQPNLKYSDRLKVFGSNTQGLVPIVLLSFLHFHQVIKSCRSHTMSTAPNQDPLQEAPDADVGNGAGDGVNESSEDNDQESYSEQMDDDQESFNYQWNDDQRGFNHQMNATQLSQFYMEPAREDNTQSSPLFSGYWGHLEFVALTAPALRELRRQNRILDTQTPDGTTQPDETTPPDERSIEEIMGIQDLEGLDAMLSEFERIRQGRETRRTANLGGPDMQELRGLTYRSRPSSSCKTEDSSSSITSTASQISSARASTFSGPYDENYSTILERNGIFTIDSSLRWERCRCANCSEFELLTIHATAEARQVDIDALRGRESRLETFLDDARSHLECLDKLYSILDMSDFMAFACRAAGYHVGEGQWVNMRRWNDDDAVQNPFYHDPAGSVSGYIGSKRDSLPPNLVARFSTLIEPFVGSPTILPNFIYTAMSFGHRLENVIERSVVVAGAIATRAFRVIRRWIRPDDRSKHKAFVIVCTMLSGSMNFYAMFVEERDEGDEYFMKHLTSVTPWETTEEYVLAEKKILVFLEWAKEQRAVLLEAMRAKWAMEVVPG